MSLLFHANTSQNNKIKNSGGALTCGFHGNTDAVTPASSAA